MLVAAVGAAADLFGVIGGPPLLKVVVGAGLLLIGAFIALKRLGTIHPFRTPIRSGIGLGSAGVLLVALGIQSVIAGSSPEGLDADGQVCDAAQDYVESYVAAATQWAAAGLRTAESDRADSQAARDLARLSQAANRSTNDDLNILVHDIRMRANLGNAQEQTDASGAVENLQGSWTSTKVLLAKCDELGFHVTQYQRLPVEPTVGKACEYLDQMVSGTANRSPDEPTAAERTRMYPLLNMFLYHGLNTQDNLFAGRVRDFAATIGKDLGPTFDRIGPTYGACVYRGYPMQLATSVPREYLVQ